jgi:hypothetical protein
MGSTGTDTTTAGGSPSTDSSSGFKHRSARSDRN